MKWNYKLLFFSLSLVLFIGLLHLPVPFFGDQAFFLLGAKEMNDGFVLYRDFWDIKQPGIFIFYLIAGKLCGFTEVGIHTFELCYWVAFFFTLVWFLKKIQFFKNEFLTYFTPAIIIGSYYSFGTSFSLTQVEALVNFPILLVIIFNYLFIKEEKRKNLWLFLSGFFGGMLIFYKLIFAPILLSVWILLFIAKIKELSFKQTLSFIIFIAVGVIIFWIPFFIYCFRNDILRLCFETYFIYPPLIIKYASEKNVEFLVNSSKAFFIKLLFILPFSFFSIFIIHKEKFIVNSLWLWLLSASMVIVMQKTSWYTYHFPILYTPIFILALIVVDILLDKLDFSNKIFRFNNPVILKLLILLFLNSFLIVSVGYKFLKLSKYGFAISEGNRRDFILKDEDNKVAYEVSKHLIQKEEAKCPIYVINNPLVYYYTGRFQAIALSTWSLQLFTPQQYEILLDELQQKKPCYIFIRAPFVEYFQSIKHVGNWINQNYSIDQSNQNGVWYKLHN